MHTSRILIVDDDLDFLNPVKEMLTSRLVQTDIDIAQDARDALDLIQRREFDAVVSDIKLPGMDGLALMRAVYTLKPDLPTLLITGHGDRELGVEALKSGAYAYMQKPLDRDYFVAWIKRAMQLTQTRRESQEHKAMLQQRTSELEKALAALQESEERFRKLEEATFEAIAITDQGTILEVNTNFAEMFGYNYKDVMGMKAEDFHPIEYRELIRMMNRGGNETPYRAVCLRKDASLFQAEIHGKSIPFNGRRVRVTAIREVVADRTSTY